MIEVNLTMQMSMLEEGVKLSPEKQDGDLQAIEFVDVLLVASECRTDKESSECQFEQRRLDDGELGQKMMVR